jgi:hypothetical protein
MASYPVDATTLNNVFRQGACGYAQMAHNLAALQGQSLLALLLYSLGSLWPRSRTPLQSCQAIALYFYYIVMLRLC